MERLPPWIARGTILNRLALPSRRLLGLPVTLSFCFALCLYVRLCVACVCVSVSCFSSLCYGGYILLGQPCFFRTVIMFWFCLTVDWLTAFVNRLKTPEADVPSGADGLTMC